MVFKKSRERVFVEKELNVSTNCRWWYSKNLGARGCRKELKDPPTAVGGIQETSEIRLLNQVVSDRIVGEFGVGAELHLVEDTSPVSTNRLVTQRQRSRNFSHGLSRRY